MALLSIIPKNVIKINLIIRVRWRVFMAGTTYPSQSPEFSPDIFCGVHVAHVFSFFVLPYYVSLRSEFRVVMSVTISA
jgi:hypothetical protein